MTKILSIFAVLVIAALVAKVSMRPTSRCVMEARRYAGCGHPCQSGPAPTTTGDAYYVTFFASQDKTNRAYLSHTWATFARLDDAGNVEERTISWLPKKLAVKVLARPEEGVNLDLRQTISWAKSEPGVSIVRWGPYRCDQELYYRAVRQIDVLNSGKVDYKCSDRRTRQYACNCEHAVADVDTDRGILKTRLQRGIGGTESVRQHLSRYLLSAGEDEQAGYVAMKLEVLSIPSMDAR